MNYSPGVQNEEGSLLLQGYLSASKSKLVGGAALAQGVTDAGNAIAGGIQQYGKVKQERESLSALGQYYFQGDDEGLAKFESASLGAQRGMIGGKLADQTRQQLEQQKAVQQQMQQQEYYLKERAQALDENRFAADLGYRKEALAANTGIARERTLLEQQELEMRNRKAMAEIAETERRAAGMGKFSITTPPELGGKVIVTDQSSGASNIETPAGMAPAKPPTPEDVTFKVNLGGAQEKLKELREVVTRSGTWEGAYVGNAADRAKLEALPFQIATMQAKLVDPASVAREGEVAAAQKYLIPLGAFKSKDVVLASIDNLEKTFASYERNRAAAQGLTPPQPVAAPAAGFTGVDAEALAWARANPSDPRSRAILQRLGVQ